MYILPDDRIAQYPAVPRDSAKLLVCENGTLTDKHVFDLPTYLESGQMVIFNNTKVIKARIVLSDFLIIKKNGERKDVESGEIFVFDVLSGWENDFEALVADGKHYRPGTRIFWSDDIWFESLRFTTEGILMRMHGAILSDFLEIYAQLPLPPYISYDKEKESDYNTVFAEYEWSVAAPTASLHFTDYLLQRVTAMCQREFVTLHVWLGTFKPLASIVEKHEMHAERLTVSVDLFEKIALTALMSKEILAVWTTALRTIESMVYIWPNIDQTQFDDTVCAWRDSRVTYEWNKDCITNLTVQWGQISCETSLYIRPPYKLQIATQLMTNFHLPNTSLLVLVQTIMGKENAKKAYEHALANEYRFYSFGDGMLISLQKNL